MNATSLTPVTVQLLETEYRISCAEEDQESLQVAAAYLDEKMQEIRRTGRVLGVERIAVMAALNISHELLNCREQSAQLSDFTLQRARGLLEKVESALSKSTESAL